MVPSALKISVWLFIEKVSCYVAYTGLKARASPHPHPHCISLSVTGITGMFFNYIFVCVIRNGKRLTLNIAQEYLNGSILFVEFV